MAILHNGATTPATHCYFKTCLYHQWGTISWLYDAILVQKSSNENMGEMTRRDISTYSDKGSLCLQGEDLACGKQLEVMCCFPPGVEDEL